MTVRRLTDRDRDKALALLMRDPRSSLILLHNMERFGLEPGSSPFQGSYFGVIRGRGRELAGLAVVYNLGALFFRAADDEAVAGLAQAILRSGRLPTVINGKAGRVESFLTGFAGSVTAAGRTASDLMILDKEGLSPAVDSRRSRAARIEDVPALLELSVRLERELFGYQVMKTRVMAELLSLQIEQGVAAVIEVNGRIVSKAEATLVPGVGAHVGGVYTLEAFRDQGHATACVAGLCRGLFDRAAFASLIVDRSNRISRRVYAKIGFGKIDDWLIATLLSRPDARAGRTG